MLFAAWLIAAPALDPSRPAPSAPDPQWLNLQRQQLTAWRDADRLARADFRGAPDRSREIFYLAPSAIEWLELAAMAAKQYAEQAVERAWAKQSPGLRRARVLQVLPEVSTVPYDLFLKHKVFAAFDELAEKKGVSTGDLVALLFPSPSA